MLILTKRWHGAHTLDAVSGVQKSHENPTPRVGGVAIFLGLCSAWGVNNAGSEHNLHFELGSLLQAGVISFAFGLVEDLTKCVSVLTRLLATMASGVAAWYLTGYSLTRLDLYILDQSLLFLPVSVAFTAFAVGGVANAINIIDGFNGLASLFALLAFIGLSLIASSVGDETLMRLSLLLATSVLGFFFVNWPLGKIFMGDGGSYFIGFSLAWICVLLTQRHSNISPFVALLICVHPVTEVLFSIFRRVTRGSNPGQPDRLHLHSLFKARYIRRWFGEYSITYQNSLAGLIVGFFTLMPVVTAQFVFSSTRWSIFATIFFVLTYLTLYSRMVHFKWVSPLRFFSVRV
jgi:UDP-N-acetylmuramyl pentapeptide phosphotransferase/UDP-N-acetylglucosamine-1-phosphate transferase